MESVLMVAALHALCFCQGEAYTLNLSQACSGTLGSLHQGRWAAVSFTNLSTESMESSAHEACENQGCGEVLSLNRSFNGTSLNNSCLTDCIIRNSTVHNCTEAPASHCLQTVEVVCEHQAIRLAAGNDSCAGRVELLDDGQWGSVCDDDWDLREGNVVCGQLGCGTAMWVTTEAAAFGPGTGPVHISELNCTGTESSLWKCITQNPVHRNYCGHKEDAGVVCSESVNVPATLKPTELNKTNCTTEFVPKLVDQKRSSRSSALALSCIGLSIVLLLLAISNIGTCSYYRGRHNAFVIPQTHSNSYTAVELQTGELRNSNSLHAVTGQTAVDGGHAASTLSQNGSSDTSSDLDYKHYYNCNVQSPTTANFPGLDDAAVVSECFQAQGRMCTEENTHKSTRSCELLDSESTSSGEGNINPQAEGKKLHNPDVNQIYLQHSWQMPLLHSTHEKSKVVDSTDSDSTSSGECYESIGTDAENLLETPQQSPTLLMLPLLHDTPQLIDSLPQPRSPNQDDSSTSSEDAYENVPKMDNDLGAREQPSQSSSDRDYDDVANW